MIVDKYNPFNTTCSAYSETLEKLSSLPGIVTHNSIVQLKSKLSTLEKDNKFILQVGECAELFSQSEVSSVKSRTSFAIEISKLINKESIVLARMGGQYSKPRSSISSDVYQGDLIHSLESMNNISPKRMLTAYECAKKTSVILSELYAKQFESNFFLSHEALVVAYENALSRNYAQDKFNLSGHSLWLGQRTCNINSAQVKYLQQVKNPIGIKVSSQTSPKSLVEIIKAINPNNKEGKIMLICRFGVNYIKNITPYLEEIDKMNLNVLWIIDPMHGNNKLLKNGQKVRYYNDILEEVLIFFDTLKNHGTYVSGLHIEATPEVVQECIDKENETLDIPICDARLNLNQTTNLIKEINKII